MIPSSYALPGRGAPYEQATATRPAAGPDHPAQKCDGGTGAGSGSGTAELTRGGDGDGEWDSPGGEDLGGLRDGEREERCDERVVHHGGCGGGHPHLASSSPLAGGRMRILPCRGRGGHESAARKQPRETERERRGLLGLTICFVLMTSASSFSPFRRFFSLPLSPSNFSFYPFIFYFLT